MAKEKKENVKKRVQKHRDAKREAGEVSQKFYLPKDYNDKFNQICKDESKTKAEKVKEWIDESSSNRES